MFYQIVLASSFLSIVAMAANIDFEMAVSTTDCTFYQRLEDKRQCQMATENSSNYMLAYGFKYCADFLAQREHAEEHIQQWSRNTMQCLQQALLEHEEGIATCTELEAFAFQSHAQCYVNNGFCTLPTSDKVSMPFTRASQSLVNHCTYDVDFSSLMANACILF